MHDFDERYISKVDSESCKLPIVGGWFVFEDQSNLFLYFYCLSTFTMVKNLSKAKVIRSRFWFVYHAVWMSVISMSKIVTGTTTHDIFGVSAPPEINYQSPVIFEFLTDFTRERHIVCFWNFDDGHHLFTIGEDLKQGVSHLFDIPGHYSVLTTCQTSRGFIHQRTQVDVIHTIDTLQCVVTDASATEREFYQQGTDIVLHYQHEYTTHLQYTLLIDGVKVYEASAVIPNPPTFLVEDSLIITDQSDELQVGHHNVTLRVTNDRVDVHCDSLVTVMSVVSGVSLSASQSAVLPADEVVLEVTAESGYPASIEWTIKKKDDESFKWNLVKEREGRTALDVDQMTVSMQDVGSYQVTARVYNNLSSDEDTVKIKTQYPVTSVVLTSNSPINFEAENTIQFSVQILDSPLPKCLNYVLEFGDGSYENSSVPNTNPWYAYLWNRDCQNGNLITISHTYTTPDVYNAKITIYNDLSSVMNETTVAVLAPISYLTMRLSHHSGIYFPSIDNDWFWQEPPFIYPVVVENEYALELRGTGTPQHVIWTMANNGDRYQHNTTGGALHYQFPTNGTFTISASASNAYSHYITQEETVTSVNAIVGQYLISNSPAVEGEVMTFVVLVQKLGLNPSFSIDYGDGLSEDVAEPQRDNTVMRFIPSNLALPSDPLKSYVTILNHTYDTEGVYAPRLTGSNTAMEWVSIAYVHVESTIHSCKIPAIHIQDGGSNYYQAKKYSPSQALIFGVSVNIDCWRAKRTTFKWSIYKIESLFTVPSSSNQVILPPSIGTDAADVYIPPYTVGYGMYIVRLTVTVVMKDAGDANMESTAHSYIEVIPSDLVARIRGGSSLAIGWYSNITLDASDSNDPDVIPGESHDDLMYTWYCHPDNASFPDNMTDIPNNLQTTTGGCFGTGFLLSDDSVSSITISAQTLAGNQSYVFLLKLSKSDRKSRYAEQTITILPGNPPTLVLRCLMNCGSQLNPSARLILTGKCTDCVASTEPSFEWTLLPGNKTNTRQTLDWSKDTTTGRYNSYLAIQAGTFDGSHDETYILRLQIASKSGSTNFAEYTFMTNSPPTLGQCTITPLEGVVLVTEFSIECSGFEDIHTPLTYKANAVTGAERSAGVSSLSDSSQQGSFLFYGVDPNIPATFLPLGLSSRDFRVEIKIQVTDSLGSSVETSLSAVVRESEGQVDIEELALKLTSDKDSQLNHLLDEGNYQSATQVINTVSSMLNVEAEKDGYQGDVEDLEKKKQQRVEARESLLDMLSQVEVNSLESIQLTSSAISQITSEVEEISPQAQVSTTKAIQSMSSLLKQQSDMGVGGEAVEGAAKFIVSGLSNIMSSTSINQGQNTSESSQFLEQDSETKQQARNITLASLHALNDVQAAIFLNKVPGEQPTFLQTDSLSIILQRQEKQDLDGLMLQTENSDVVFRLPAGLSTAIDQHGASSYDEVIDTQIHHFQHNPFSWSESSSRVTSHVTSLKLGHGIDQSDIAVQTLPQDVEMMVINGDNIKPMLLHESFNQLTNQVLFSLNVTNEESSVIITVGFNQSSDPLEALALNLSLYYGSPPNNTNTPCNASTTLPSNPMENQMKWNTTNNMTFDPYTWVIPSEKISETGAYFMTVDGGEGVDVRNLHLLVYAFGSQCLYWDEATEEWLGDGCKVGPLTSTAKTHCLCNHLTSFASSILVMPNAIDLTDISLFANVAENPVTLIAVVVVFLLFGLGAVWAHRKDRLGKEQARLIVLEDNDPQATYRYHITVFTGMRRGAGTTAAVTLTLQGIVASSEPHVLATDDKKYPVLKSSGVDSFLLMTKESLGILRSVRVWHDNAGSSPEWYLSRVLVHDLEKDSWWYFLCHTWLAVDLADGEIDKTFPVATPEDLKGFHHLFFTKSVRDMKEYHLWFSVLSRPPRSSFTRLQRLACCLSLLLSTMLVNIMFYKAGEGKEDETYNFGVMSVSLNTIVIAVESSLLAVPINLVIVQIFRDIRPRKEEVEIVPMSEEDEMHDNAKVEEAQKNSELQAAPLNMPTAPSISSSINSQNSNTGISLAPESPSELTISLDPQSVHNSSAKSRDTLPEKELFIGDEAYEEYTDMHAEFVYLCSTCTGLNNFKSTTHKSSQTSSSNIHPPESKQNTKKTKVSVEGSNTKQEQQQHLRLELLPECDQAILSHYIRELTPELSRNQNTNRNSSASSNESSAEQNSSLSNQSGHSTSSISISISSPSSNESATYTNYQEYLSTRLSMLYEQLNNPPPNLFKSERDRKRALRKFKLVLALHGWEEERDSSSSSEEEHKNELQKLFVMKGRLPWWCVYIAWFLVVSSSLFAAYLIILYGLTFGKEKSIEWLVAMFISLFQSIVVIQPVQVIAITAFFAIVVKSYEHDDIGARFFRQLKRYTGHQASTTSIDTRTFPTNRQRNSHFYCPPTENAVELARERKLIDSKMYSVIKAFLGQLLFIWLVVQVGNGQRDPNSIYLHQAMTNSFSSQLNKVITMADVYGWMKLEFIPALYGDDQATLADSFLVGSPRLRQLRVKQDRCVNPEAYYGLRPECHPIPSGLLDKGSYSTSWAQLLSTTTTSRSSNPWVYQTEQQARGNFFLTDPGRYHRGGFIANLGMTRDAAENVTTILRDALWIDQYTQAVIVEWVMYNANVNLFSVNTLICHAEGTTKVVTAQDFVILRIYRYTNKFDKFVLTLEVTYILVVVLIAFMEIKKWNGKREDYWVFWNYLTIIIILLSAVATTAYIWEYVLAAETMKLHVSNRVMYVSFANIVLLDYILILSLSGIVFCSILKCLKILHYNNSIFLIQNTISSLSGKLASVIFLLLIAVMAFAFFGHIAFGSHFQDFSGFLLSIVSVFILILRKYDKMLEVIEEFGVQAYFLFAAGNFLLVAVVMNAFIALIMDSYSKSKKKFVKYKNHGVVTVLLMWFLSAFSIKERQKRLHKHNSLQQLDIPEEM